MERKELEAQVIQMVATSYKQDAASLSTETLFKEDLGGASIHVELMLADASGCATIGDLVDLIEGEM